MILLDTDVLIEIFDKTSERGDGARRAILESGEDIATISINLHEILYGLEKYAKPMRDILLLPVIGYTRRDARLSSDVELRAEGIRKAIRQTDSMIDAVAMNYGASLYTFDLKHFQPIVSMGLRLFTVNG